MDGIFKAYDIRGIFGESLTPDIARRIGRAFVTFLKCRRVVVGQDMRPHSPLLFAALTDGLTSQGADVFDIGLCSTPMSYFANGSLNADASIMITASHNPCKWNGFKLCRQQAIPISGDTGIKEIEAIVAGNAYAPIAERRGEVSRVDVAAGYVHHVQSAVPVPRPLRIAADFANSMGILEAEALKGVLKVDPLFDILDGSFPNHEANPLKAGTLVALQKRVRSGAYAFGVAFDGDADRVGFIDETGTIIPMDMVTALIARSILASEKGPVFYDLRSSWAVKEEIVAAGGTPMMSRVGHAFIKQQMRDAEALFAGELSGHYYFRDNFYAESAAMAVLCLAAIVAASSQPLSALVRPIRRYFASGEINSEVADPPAALRRLKNAYGHKGKLLELDGISVEFADWWFNVRMSNTESLVRLNLEAKTKDVMTLRRDELLAMIRA